MKSIQTAVESEINDSPLLKDVLLKGIVNHTALARSLQKTISEKTKKAVGIAAIVMAIQRCTAKLAKTTIAQTLGNPIAARLSIRYNLSLYTFAYSADIHAAHDRCIRVLRKDPDAFFNVSYGVNEVSCVWSTAYAKHVQDAFAGCTVLSTEKNLAAISIHFTQETADIPGMYFVILEALAWKDVSCVELMSAGNELTIVLRSDDVQRAFQSLEHIIQQHRPEAR